MQDALAYLELVQLTFRDRLDIYLTFLGVMRDFAAGTIDTPGVVSSISQLFQGHEALLRGFHNFLNGISRSDPVSALAAGAAGAAAGCAGAAASAAGAAAGSQMVDLGGSGGGGGGINGNNSFSGGALPGVMGGCGGEQRGGGGGGGGGYVKMQDAVVYMDHVKEVLKDRPEVCPPSLPPSFPNFLCFCRL